MDFCHSFGEPDDSVQFLEFPDYENEFGLWVKIPRPVGEI